MCTQRAAKHSRGLQQRCEGDIITAEGLQSAASGTISIYSTLPKSGNNCLTLELIFFFLQEAFGKFQQFIDLCVKYSVSMDEAELPCGTAVKSSHLTLLPEHTMTTYVSVCHLGLENSRSVQTLYVNIQHLLFVLILKQAHSNQKPVSVIFSEAPYAVG